MSDLLSTGSKITIFVRHSADCPYKGDENHRGCRCRKHLRWSYRGLQKRISAKTRSWAEAEKQRTKLLRQFGVTDDPVLESTDRTTIEQSVDTFLIRKQTEGVSDGVLKKYRRELRRLQAFCSSRNKLFPDALTLPLLEGFRGTWAADYPGSMSVNADFVNNLLRAKRSGQRVNVETSKTDRDGEAVHEECLSRGRSKNSEGKAAVQTTYDVYES
jgi:hypothetical protein